MLLLLDDVLMLVSEMLDLGELAGLDEQEEVVVAVGGVVLLTLVLARVLVDFEGLFFTRLLFFLARFTLEFRRSGCLS